MSLPACTSRARSLAVHALLGLAALGPSAADATIWTAPGLARPTLSATLEQCLTAGPQAERSATFAGEMSGVVGSARLEMRIEVAERLPEEISYHTVTAPGLGVWRSAAPGVKVYRYLKQVTNLAGPAFYRGVVHFRWLSSRGRLLADAILHTKRCEQPTTSIWMPAPGPAGASAPGS
ncbi:MAG TPA: hypothetical protein VG366_07445 [Solirubrobacteraceae bacterium]|nr:hypothetical protein [Solirubrobacteraceae bacterium]